MVLDKLNLKYPCLDRDLVSELNELEQKAQRVVMEYLVQHEGQKIELKEWTGPRDMYKEFGTIYPTRMMYKEGKVMLSKNEDVEGNHWLLENAVLWGYDHCPCPYLQLLHAIPELQQQDMWDKVLNIELSSKECVVQLFDLCNSKYFIFPAKRVADSAIKSFDFDIDGEEVLGPKELFYGQRARLVELRLNHQTANSQEPHDEYCLIPYVDDTQADCLMDEEYDHTDLSWFALYERMLKAILLLHSKGFDLVQWQSEARQNIQKYLDARGE